MTPPVFVRSAAVWCLLSVSLLAATVQEKIPGSAWSWRDIKGPAAKSRNGWDEVRFERDGTFTGWRRGQQLYRGKWAATGAESLQVLNADGSARLNISFGPEFHELRSRAVVGNAEQTGEPKGQVAAVATAPLPSPAARPSGSEPSSPGLAPTRAAPDTALEESPFPAPPPADASGSRFSAEIRRFLESHSASYRLNGQPQGDNSIDARAVLRELQGTGDAVLRKAVEVRRQIFEFVDRQEAARRELYGAAASSTGAIDPLSLLNQPGADDFEKAQNFTKVPAILEARVAADEAELGWLRLLSANRKKVAALAYASPPRVPLLPGPIVARFDPAAGAKGEADVVNRSGKPLRHCLIITHYEIDRAKLEADFSDERSIGNFMAAAGGNASPSALQRGTELQTELLGTEFVTVVWVPEIPMSGVVRFPSFRVRSGPWLRKMELSFWSDEASLDDLEVQGLPAVLAALEAMNPRRGQTTRAPEKRDRLDPFSRPSSSGLGTSTLQPSKSLSNQPGADPFSRPGK